jgi:hypothetical protein
MPLVETKAPIGIHWYMNPGDLPINTSLKQAVQLAFGKEIPAWVADEWSKNKTMVATPLGSKSIGDIAEELNAAVVELNEARHAIEARAPDFALQAGPSRVCYHYTDSKRWCVTVFPLHLGGNPWEIADPGGGGVSATLEIRMTIEWVI